MPDMYKRHQTAETLRRAVVFAREVAFHFSRDRVMILASGVVYSTLISMVPFLAFTMALLSAFGTLTEVQNYLQEYVLVHFGEAAETGFAQAIEGFLINAGGLGVVGLVSFMVTSVFLLNRVWMTVNHIYRTSLHSNMLVRMSRFITVLVVSTLLLSAYVSVTTLVRRELFVSVEEVDFIIRFMRLVSPWVFMFLVHFFLILMVPNTKVKVASAALGAVTGVLLFQISNALFTWFVNQVLTYSIIYGSLATVLVFLLWVYLIWIIIFLGVEVSYVHQYQPNRHSASDLTETPSELLAHGIDILVEISRSYKRGEGAVSVKELSLRLSLPGEKLASYVSILEDSGFIIRVDKSGRSYVPARPLEDLKIRDALKVLYGVRGQRDTAQTSGHVLAARMLRAALQETEDATVQDLINGMPTVRKQKENP